MKNNNEFLPIGTVVVLKNGTKKVMINAYGVFPTDKVFSKGKETQRKKELFKYGGCIYPEGIIDSNTIFAFNHEDIDKIYHMGMISPEYNEFVAKIKSNYDNYKKQFESNENN